MNSGPKTVAVVGSGNQLSRRVTAHLLLRGHQVKNMVRDRRIAEEWVALGAQPFVAHVTDDDLIARRIEGIDALIIVPSSELSERSVEALASLKAPLTVLSSVMGAHLPIPHLKFSNELERRLEQKGRLRIVRHAFVMERLWSFVPEARVTGRLRSLFPREAPVPSVAATDIADKLVRAVEDTQLGAVLELEGPRRYRPLDVARLLDLHLARHIEAEVVDRAEWFPVLRTMGVTETRAATLAQEIAAFNAGALTFEGVPVRGPTPLEDVLARNRVT